MNEITATGRKTPQLSHKNSQRDTSRPSAGFVSQPGYQPMKLSTAVLE
jgi:hypothetical protein